MSRLSALQKLLCIITGFIIVFIYVSFPATKTVIDPNTQLQVEVTDYVMTTVRAGLVLLLSSLFIVHIGRAVEKGKKYRPTSKNKKKGKKRR